MAPRWSSLITWMWPVPVSFSGCGPQPRQGRIDQASQALADTEPPPIPTGECHRRERKTSSTRTESNATDLKDSPSRYRVVERTTVLHLMGRGSAARDARGPVRTA